MGLGVGHVGGHFAAVPGVQGRLVQVGGLPEVSVQLGAVQEGVVVTLGERGGLGGLPLQRPA